MHERTKYSETPAMVCQKLSIVRQFISCLLQDTLIIEKGQYDKNCFSFVPGFIIMLCICESEGDSRYGIQDGGADRRRMSGPPP